MEEKEEGEGEWGENKEKDTSLPPGVTSCSSNFLFGQWVLWLVDGNTFLLIRWTEKGHKKFILMRSETQSVFTYRHLSYSNNCHNPK